MRYLSLIFLKNIIYYIILKFRLALERASTADEAISVISEIVKNYGSDKKGKEAPTICLLLGDMNSVYIMDIIGKIWACEKLETNRVLGAGISIENKLDKISEDFKRQLISLCLWNEDVSLRLYLVHFIKFIKYLF